MVRQTFRARPALVGALVVGAAVAGCAGHRGTLAVPVATGVATGAGATVPPGSSPAPSDLVCTDGGPVTVAAGPRPEPSEIIRTSDAVNTLGGAELLPTGFPVPPGFTVGQVLRVTDVAITADILPGDVNAAYRYLLTALPAAGYTVTGCGTAPAVASIMFTGHECVGADTEVVLSLVTSSVVCDLGGGAHD